MKVLTFCNPFNLRDSSRPHLPYYDKMCFFSSYICTVKYFLIKILKNHLLNRLIAIWKMPLSRLRVFSKSSQSQFRIILRIRFLKEKTKKWKCFTVPKKIQTYTYKILTVQLKTIRAIKLPLKTESVTAIAAYVTAGLASCYSWQTQWTRIDEMVWKSIR